MNSKAFIPKEVEKGLHLDLIKYLLDYNAKSEDYYYDIHITTDGYCLTVEWTDVSTDRDINWEDEKFKLVDYDHVVAYEGTFPDNSLQLFYDKEQYEEVLKEWLKENPGWVKTEYGNWIHEADTAKFSEDTLEVEKETDKASNKKGK